MSITPKMDTIALTTPAIPNIPVGKAERDEALARVEKQLAGYAINNFDKSKVSASKPGIAGLQVDSDGRLWVQHNLVYGVHSTTFEVFDAKAKHLGRVVLPIKTNSYLPIRAQGNLLWLVVFDEDDVQYIAHYRLQQ
ncbi:MAG: hypothetical protein H7Z40_07405 [Phycisphaerae bacterium]|nr:hypothetical protein [Gemmatimonadaceae bacterium]